MFDLVSRYHGLAKLTHIITHHNSWQWILWLLMKNSSITSFHITPTINLKVTNYNPYFVDEETSLGKCFALPYEIKKLKMIWSQNSRSQIQGSFDYSSVANKSIYEDETKHMEKLRANTRASTNPKRKKKLYICYISTIWV